MNIPESVLATARAWNDDLMPDSAVIKRRTQAVDSYGGTAATYATSSTVPCRIIFRGEKPLIQEITAWRGEQLNPADTYEGVLPLGTDVQESDRLLVNGNTYEIVTQLDARSYQMAVRVLLKRLTH